MTIAEYMRIKADLTGLLNDGKITQSQYDIRMKALQANKGKSFAEMKYLTNVGKTRGSKSSGKKQGGGKPAGNTAGKQPARMTQEEYEAAKKEMYRKYKNGEITNYAYIKWKKENNPALNPPGNPPGGPQVGSGSPPGGGDIEERLKRIYREAKGDLEEKLREFTEKSAKKAAEMKEKLDRGEITKRDYATWMHGQIFQTEQWKQKVDQVTGTLLDANRQAMQIINDEKMGVFADNANFQAYRVTKESGLNLSFSIYDVDTVANLIKKEPELLPRKVVDGKKDKAWNRTQIANAVAQAVIQGESIPDLAKRIARDTASTNMKAMVRYARTAMTGAQNAGRMETLHRAKGMGIGCKKTWLATLDRRTRDSHRKLDGKTIEIDEKFEGEFGKLMYPGDPEGHPGDVYNCRCTLVYEYDGFENVDAERIAYNEYVDEDGKKHRESYYVKDMTYQQWVASRGGNPGGVATPPAIPPAAPPATPPAAETGGVDGKDLTDEFEANDEKEKANKDYLSRTEDWEKRITQEDKEALQDFTGGKLQKETNGWLRHNENDWDQAQEDDIEANVARLDKTIEKEALKEKTTVYRGVEADYLGLDFSDPDKLIGTVAEDRGFLSTTGSEEVASKYGKGVVLEIEAPKGTHVAYADLAKEDREALLKHPGDIEYLMERGCELKFTGYTKEKDADGNEYLKMQCELVPRQTKRDRQVNEIMKSASVKQMTDEQKKEFRTVLEGMSDQNLALYKDMTAFHKKNDYNLKNTGWYDPAKRKVEMELSETVWEKRIGRSDQGAWKVKIHEELHQLDHIMARTNGDIYGRQTSGAGTNTTPEGVRLRKAIEQDCVDFFNKAVDWYNAKNSRKTTNITDINDHISDRQKKAIFDMLEDETKVGSKYSKESERNRALISAFTDAVGLATNGRVHPQGEGYWGHTKKYSSQKGVNGATSECYAEIGSHLMREDKESLEALAKYMPNAVREYKRVLREHAEFVRNNKLHY